LRLKGSKLVEEVMVLKRARSAAPDIERRLPDLQPPEEVERGNFARSLCPCHAGWEVFEQHVGLVIRLLSDRSHVVRAQALHVFEDAVRMQAAEDLRYYLRPEKRKLVRSERVTFGPWRRG
jgi:hypothetical protein